MWTPKRILLLFGALSVLAIIFGVYAYFLGGIDGLPALPTEYLPITGKDHLLLPDDFSQWSEVDRKLRFAFGSDCPEISRTIKAEVSKKGLAFATADFKIMADGRVRFKPFSLAIFNKDRQPGAFPEINTVRSSEALLTLDRPITSMADMGDRKIVGAELRGQIKITNNRRTLQLNDDIEVLITGGPLFFSEPKKQVWSDGFVKVLDTQSQPNPTMITAKGMKIYLDKDTPLTGRKKGTPRIAKAKGADDKVSAVQRIVLLSNVDMHIYIDADSGFLSGGPTNKKQPRQTRPTQLVGRQKPDAPPKSHVHAKTQGSFTYDLIKDLAVFDGAQRAAEELLYPGADRVIVTRIHKQGEDGQHDDQLECDHLELQFRRKKNVDPRLARTNRTADREITSARAVVRSKNDPNHRVKLVLSSENLEANGFEMIYRSATEERGPETIVRGTPKIPMWAIKDAHKITAVELYLKAANAKGREQAAHAKGPGQIDLMDLENKKVKSHQYHVLFAQAMTVTKDREGGKEFDLLTFTGNAAFIDDAGKQELRAEKLQVWVQPAERTRSPEEIQKRKSFKVAGAPRQQPHKLEGFGMVRVQSPQLRVKQCDHLIVHFKEGSIAQLPPAAPVVRNSSAQGKEYVVQRPDQTQLRLLPPTVDNPAQDKKLPSQPSSTLQLPGRGNQADTASRQQQNGAKKEKQQRPIDLRAREVSVVVTRAHNKNEVKKVVSEGNVHVHQEGSTPQDKGVDIVGQTLDLDRDPLGNVLIVFGNADKPARLQLGELILMGRKVTINQKDNTAEIDGDGAMNMPSKTTFDGAPPANPKTRLTVVWKKDMFFNGEYATFHGDVIAYQDNSSLRCPSLHVYLDRKVSLKEGEKKNKGAKVERLVCSGRRDSWVDIVETKKDRFNNTVRFDRLIAFDLTVDNRSGPVRASGPGRVYLWQEGSASLDGKKQNKKQKQFYLTRVDFTGLLFSTKHKDQSRIATFRDNVEVFHIPAASPYTRIDRNKLPKGSVVMTCQRLVLKSRPGGKEKSTNLLIATNGVKFETDDFYGFASQVTYDQADDKIVFEGTVGNPARLFRLHGIGPNGNRQQIVGQKILYNRRTGEFDLQDGKQILGGR